jgi:hypothetical protein
MSLHIDTQSDVLLTKLLKFYSENTNFDKMINIINGSSSISLRIVDWFVTNYSKKNYIVYMINKDNKMEKVNVYNDYKLKLKAYSKKKFDPFCRWDRINVPYKEDKFIQTTLGQLNFFKWTIENKILEYIEENYKIIETDMNLRNCCSKVKNCSINSTTSTSSCESSDSYSSTSSSNNNKTRKKREELSSNASRSINKEFIITTVEFK